MTGKRKSEIAEWGGVRSEESENHDAALERSESDSKKTLIYRFANMQGIGTRENQEDSFAFSNIFDPALVETHGAMAVVADGMGGLRGGKRASETAVSVIRQDFASMDMTGNIAEQLNAGLIHASEEVETAVNGQGGSTAVMVVIYRDRLYYASVGDSYLYLKRGEYLTRINRFHTVMTDALEELIEDGEMNPAEVLLNDNPAALTEFLGMNPLNRIDCFKRSLRLRYGDVLLLCTDGVSGTVNEQTIEKTLSLETPVEMCAALEAAVVSMRKRHQDNYTALIIQCTYP